MNKTFKAAIYETHGNPAEVLRVVFKSPEDDRKTPGDSVGPTAKMALTDSVTG
jgi:hypothetical protein